MALPPYVLAAIGTLALAAATLHHVLRTWARTRALKQLGEPPLAVFGSWPFGIDLVARIIRINLNNNHLEDARAWFTETGRHTVQLNFLGATLIMTDEPENTKALLATQFSDYGKGWILYETLKTFLGDGIFNTDGHAWSNSRHLARSIFSKERISDLHCFESHIQKMIKHIPADGTSCDLQNLFFRFTLDSATDFLLGESINSLDNPNVLFAKAFEHVQDVAATRANLGSWWRLYYSRTYGRDIKILEDFVEPYVERTILSARTDEKKEKNKDFCFLDALAEFTTDRRVLRDQFINMLLAARDTTAATLSWVFYELARNPLVFLTLKNEIVERLGTDTIPTYDDIKEMKYLQNVINETLRCYPAVGQNVRYALKDTTLPLGGGPDGLDRIYVRKGEPVGYSVMNMHRRSDLWGPDADEWKPERWYKSAPKPWTFLPFNGGPRVVSPIFFHFSATNMFFFKNSNFALTEMGYTIIRILQHFSIIENRDFSPRIMKKNIILTSGT
ncbi:Cytochrome P450 52A13, partial [Neolecta irregularis DAH-3]